MRLFYHPESGAYFLEEPDGVWRNDADGMLCEDVSDEDFHRSMAVLEGIDLDEITEDDEIVSKSVANSIAQSLVEPEDDFWAMPSQEQMPAIRKAASRGLAGAITDAMAKWARKPADLYPTPYDCTYSLLPHIADLLPAEARVLEPACADGMMVRPMREFGYRVDGYDLRPEVTGGQGGFDFLAPHGTVYDWVGCYDAVITNPPFSAAEGFIRRALEEAPVAVMLLKAQYWNTKNRKKLFRETKPYKELNLTWRPAFLEAERGKSPLMDCMWVVWVRGHDGSCTTEMIDRLLECPVNLKAMDMGGL